MMACIKGHSASLSVKIFLLWNSKIGQYKIVILYTSKYKSIGEIQTEFNNTYPFLRIEFPQKKNCKKHS
jgi:hypothetical protein